MEHATRNLEALAAVLPLGVIVHDGEIIRLANPAAVALLAGDDTEELVSVALRQVVRADFLEVVADRAHEVLSAGRTWPARDVPLVALNGRELIAEITDVPVRHGGRAAVASVVRDVTSERQGQSSALASAEALANEHVLLQTVFENVGDGVALLDGERRILFANRAYGEIFGLPSAALVGLDRPRFLAHVSTLVDDPAATIEKFNDLSQLEGETSADFELKRPRRRVLNRKVRPVRLVSGAGYVVVWHDVTAERDLAAERDRHALIDPLTGLLNRRGAEQQLVRERARARRTQAPLSLAIFDVDHFKRVNDQHGHAVGDEVLFAVARVLANELRVSDVVVRWGGDELIAILPGTREGALVLSERVRAAVARLGVPAVDQVTVSVGVTELRGHDEPLADALARADQALYRAKQAGRNRVEG